MSKAPLPFELSSRDRTNLSTRTGEQHKNPYRRTEPSLLEGLQRKQADHKLPPSTEDSRWTWGSQDFVDLVSPSSTDSDTSQLGSQPMEGLKEGHPRTNLQPYLSYDSAPGLGPPGYDDEDCVIPETESAIPETESPEVTFLPSRNSKGGPSPQPLAQEVETGSFKAAEQPKLKVPMMGETARSPTGHRSFSKHGEIARSPTAHRPTPKQGETVRSPTAHRSLSKQGETARSPTAHRPTPKEGETVRSSAAQRSFSNQGEPARLSTGHRSSLRQGEFIQSSAAHKSFSNQGEPARLSTGHRSPAKQGEFVQSAAHRSFSNQGEHARMSTGHRSPLKQGQFVRSSAAQRSFSNQGENVRLSTAHRSPPKQGETVRSSAAQRPVQELGDAATLPVADRAVPQLGGSVKSPVPQRPGSKPIHTVRSPAASRPVPKLADLDVNSSVEDKLAIYRARVKELTEVRQAKPDMVAYKELSAKLTAKDVIGHLENVKVGQRVFGKGELAILGIHCSIVCGIHQKKGSPAFAIALAGGYADDDDSGAEFWYTGTGGQSKRGDQIADQSFSVAGNAALKKSFELQTPVRVVRRHILPNQSMPAYVYEGLYLVESAIMAQGTHGFQICRFKMVAVPGESTVSTKVEHGKAVNFRQTRLAVPGKRKPSAGKKPALKRKRSLKMSIPGEDNEGDNGPATSSVSAAVSEPVQDLQWILPQRTRATRLLLEDFSRGEEAIPLPVYGNSEADITALPKPFTYIRSSMLVSQAAEQVFEWSKSAFRWDGDRCGIKTMGAPYILPDGRLTETLIRGLFECGLGPSCKSPECQYNYVVSDGYKLPLEIFMTDAHGWGLRCSTSIPIGTFICEYIGEVCSDTEAEARPHEYLFDMDHFVLAEEGTPIVAVLPHDADERTASGQDALLVIDGHKCGNLGRFLNHSCEGNVLLQPTFAAGSCPHMYRVALFASRDIPPFEELTYHYGWSPREGDNEYWIRQGSPQREVWCCCGSQNCQGRLL